MKKSIILIATALSCAFLSFSCQKAEEAVAEKVAQGKEDPAGKPVTISATLSEALTKVTFTPSFDNNGNPASLSLTWAEGDKIRIYNHDDRSKYQDFTLVPECIGQKAGKFTGTSISATKYDVEVYNGALDYASQTQPSDGVTSNLKYLASVSGVDSYENVTFTDFSSVLAITAKMPSTEVAAAVKSVDITASENIFNGGNLLTITFDTIGDAGDDEILCFFATLPQGNHNIAADTKLVFHFNAPGTTHTVYTRYVELPSSTFTAAKLNTIKINASQSDKHAGVLSCDGTTEDKAYLIGDKYQLKAISSIFPANSKRYFKMVDDVDLNKEAWTPYNTTDDFKREIVFDGDGHTIYNLKSSGTYASFSGVLNGIVKNVTFSGADINGGSSKCGVIGGFIGTEGIVGSCENVTVTESTVTGTGYVGGFAAHIRSIGSLTGCTVQNSTVSGTGYLGGFVAFTDITGSDKYEVPARFNDCHVVDVTVNQNNTSGGEMFTGGFIGYANTGSGFTGCTVKATVNADKSAVPDIGGFIGRAGNACPTFKDCEVIAGTTVSAKGNHVGGFVGYSMIAASYTNCSSAATVTNTSEYTGGFAGYSAGSSTYTDCSAFGNVTGVKHVGGFAGLAENSGFMDCRYSGGIVTDNISSGRTDSAGFCGYATNGVSFRGCAVENATVSVLNGQRVGGFVGQLGVSYSASNNIDLSQCHVSGTSVTGKNNTGAFAGVQYDNIDRSYVSGGSVTARANNCGGFSAYVQQGNVSNCYTTATVNGGSYTNIGGFAGLSYNTTISSCFAAGAVSGTGSNIGAFVGQCAKTSTTSASTIDDCIGWHATLPFAGSNTVGAAITNCYAGNEGTVVSHASSWDISVWNLSAGDLPVLLDKPRRINAIFIGDSITWQWAVTSRSIALSNLLIPYDPKPSYMDISGSNATVYFHPGFFTGNGYVDKGVSGQNTTQMLARFQKDIIALNPVVAVIMAGTNDLAQGVTKEQIVANISAMAEMAEAAGIKVVLCTVTPCNDSYSKLSNPKTKGAHIITLNDMIKDYADSKGFAWCDYWSHLVADDGLALHPDYCLYDRLHPGPAGYDVMEGIIRPIINSLL